MEYELLRWEEAKGRWLRQISLMRGKESGLYLHRLPKPSETSLSLWRAKFCDSIVYGREYSRQIAILLSEYQHEALSTLALSWLSQVPDLFTALPLQ